MSTFETPLGTVQIDEIHPGIHLVLAEHREVLGQIFKRIQEFYENPYFQGTSFTHAQFDEWYSSKFETRYEEYWDGYNFPGYLLQRFIEKFDDFTYYEKGLISHFEEIKTPFYVIGCVKDDDATLMHEVAHAMYFLNPIYREKIDKIMIGTNFSPIISYLKRNMYADSVLVDEIHAYLLFEKDDLADEGIDLAPYEEISSKLYEVFNSYFEIVPE